MPIDRLFGPHDDLSDTNVQLAVHEALRDAAFIAAAFDCSTKSRCRQIPSKIPGKNLPPPFRSDEYPMGLPGLQGSDKERVGHRYDEFMPVFTARTSVRVFKSISPGIAEKQ